MCRISYIHFYSYTPAYEVYFTEPMFETKETELVLKVESNTTGISGCVEVALEDTNGGTEGGMSASGLVPRPHRKEKWLAIHCLHIHELATPWFHGVLNTCCTFAHSFS